MPKIRNLRLKGLRSITAQGVIQFDNNGIAEINDRELYLALLKIPGFEPVEEAKDLPKSEPIEAFSSIDSKPFGSLEEEEKPVKKSRKKKKEEEEEPKEEIPEAEPEE